MVAMSNDAGRIVQCLVASAKGLRCGSFEPARLFGFSDFLSSAGLRYVCHSSFIFILCALQSKGFNVITGTIVDATIIDAPSSTKNQNKARGPEMHQTRKVQQWYFGMKLHIDVNSQSGLTHSAVVTPANVHYKYPLPDLLHGHETDTPIRASSGPNAHNKATRDRQIKPDFFDFSPSTPTHASLMVIVQLSSGPFLGLRFLN
jgi:hypothetical protein